MISVTTSVTISVTTSAARNRCKLRRVKPTFDLDFKGLTQKIKTNPKAIAYDIKLVIRTFEDYNPIHG